ncbi:phage major tail tube protein [Gynuella sunshinyii]|uniref:Phage tail tube protein FII n=1 Tax=Gynuella sunshinyii YC6258 TaxID=1445510 RepID=A0A0C5VGC6_9GAMM|nr:phage major tail tube protein [Gynuella sunshinyii]AJQ93231.1 phage tail tube protein FII [Gynuella sunshinyii YC6258]
MLVPKVLKNFNLFIAGQGYAGRIQQITLPKLTLRTEEYRLGGLDTGVKIDMGMEPMECELILSEYDAELIRRFGIPHADMRVINYFGASNGSVELLPLEIRGALSDEDQVMPLKINASGSITELDMGQWQPGQQTQLRLHLSLRYYRLELNQETLIEIDVDNRERKIAGKNQIPKGSDGFI